MLIQYNNSNSSKIPEGNNEHRKTIKVNKVLQSQYSICLNESINKVQTTTFFNAKKLKHYKSFIITQPFKTFKSFNLKEKLS